MYKRRGGHGDGKVVFFTEERRDAEIFLRKKIFREGTANKFADKFVRVETTAYKRRHKRFLCENACFFGEKTCPFFIAGRKKTG